MMMKRMNGRNSMQCRIIAAVLAAMMVLLLLVTASADSSWTCVCGQKGNTGNFCPFCGRSRPGNDSWTCPGCGHRNKAAYNYCENCGHEKLQAEQWALTTMRLSINDGPGTSRYFNEIGTYNVQGQMARVFARSWDTDNDIWWIQCEIPGTDIIGWTGLKRFDQNTFDLDALPVVTYDRKTRRYVK